MQNSNEKKNRYVVVDIVIDLFCTVCTILEGRKYIDSKSTFIKNLFDILVFENVVRTVFVLAANVVILWIVLSGSFDPNVASLFNMSQFLLYSVLLNSEVYWSRKRSEAVAGSLAREID
ncbi:hypothetical protein HDU98_011757 [Podochytrium sp. JEL0797]|nr:hypothetical protein HDU98_011757 [Podochytrium sp. JEL0797]